MPISTETSHSPDVAEKTSEETEISKPKKYKVILHNDEKTTFQFVIELLCLIFHKTTEEAVRVTEHIHMTGTGIAGIYSLEIAEEKTNESIRLARAHGFPLIVTYEEL